MRRLLWLLCAMLAMKAAMAHKASDSPLTVAAAGTGLELRWDIALRDLELAVGLDADGDGNITWGELRRRHDAVAAYATAQLSLLADGRACTLTERAPMQVDEHSDGAYAVLWLRAECGAAPRALEIGYRLLAGLDAQHRGLLRLRGAGGQEQSAVLVPSEPPRRFELQAAPAGPWATLRDYGAQGVWHIWVGFDHILFLLCLLLPAVLRHDGRHWQPLPRARDAAWEVLRVVTAFTVAHSLTLAAATLGWVVLPSRWVESVIALSVVLAALNNLKPVVATRWALGLGFGLVHGFGFASVLAGVGLPPGALALALLGLNLGVEVGQLAIVAAVLPPALALALARPSLYVRGVLGAGSVLVAAVATLWFVQRAFNL